MLTVPLGSVERDESKRSWGQVAVREFFGAAVSALLAFIGFWLISGLRLHDLGGLWGRNDVIFEYGISKALPAMGAGFLNPNLGYPWGQDWTHFPVLDLANRLELHFLNLFLDPVTAVNLLFVLSFPLIAAFMYLSLRNLHVMRSLAVVGGVSLSLVGYHFDNEHPFLGNYWAIPVGIVWLSIIANANSVLTQHCRKRTVILAGLLSGIAVGIHNPQYAVFFSIIGGFVLLLTPAAPLRQLGFRLRLVLLLVPGAALLAFIAAGRLLRTVPAVTSSSDRPIVDSYLWGGKLFSLFTVPGDSIVSSLPPNEDLLAAQETSVWTGVSAILSAPAAVAGIVTAGLVLTIVTGMLGRSQASIPRVDPVRPWAASWVVGTTFFITGGMGVVFATLVYPQVRGWMRLAVILAALALTAALVFASSLLRDWKRRGTPKSRIGTVAVGVLIFVVFMDQFTARYPIQSDNTTLPALNALTESPPADFAEDCAVLNVPVKSFPEAIPPGRMQAYDHLLPYLADTPWRFSYGGVRGQLGSRWTDHLAIQPDPLAAQAAAEGFCAILVDSYGLDERTPSLAQYELALGPATTSALDRWFLFTLPKTAQVETANSVFSRPEVNYGSDFTSEEVSDGGVVSRWTKESDSTIQVWNPSYEEFEWIAQTGLTAADCPNGQDVRLLTDSGFSETFKLAAGERRDVLIPLRLPARGSVTIELQTPSAVCPQKEDSTRVGVRINDLRFTKTQQVGAHIATSTGFHPQEVGPSGETWQWIDGGDASVELLSTSDQATPIALTGSLQAPPCQPTQVVEVKINGRFFQAVTVTAQALTSFTIPVELAPWRSANISFSSASPGCTVAEDERLLGPKVQDLRITSGN